jgi:hypothetical protein
MTTLDAVAALPIYRNLNAPFNQLPLLSTNTTNPLALTNLVHISRVATIPYFAYSSDSDACPSDIDSSTNLIVTFKHYPTNNPANGIYITVAVTDTNGNSPRYTNYSTNITTNNGHITTNIFTNVYDGGNTGFYVVPSTLGSQTITFPQIPQQALSNNIVNIATNYLTNGSNVSISFDTPNSFNVVVLQGNNQTIGSILGSNTVSMWSRNPAPSTARPSSSGF